MSGGGGGGGSGGSFAPIASSPSEAALGLGAPSARHDTAAHDEEEEEREDEMIEVRQSPRSASQRAAASTSSPQRTSSSLSSSPSPSTRSPSQHKAFGTGVTALSDVELRRLRPSPVSSSSTSSAVSSLSPVKLAAPPPPPPASLPEALAALASAHADIAALQARLDALQADQQHHRHHQQQHHPHANGTANAHGSDHQDDGAFSNKGMDHSSNSTAGSRLGLELERSRSHTRDALEHAYEKTHNGGGGGGGGGAMMLPSSDSMDTAACHGLDVESGGAVEAPGHTMSLQEYFATPFYVLLLRRLPWLVGLLLLQSFSASILHGYDEYLNTHMIFSFFIPMIVGTGGNAGNQCSVMVTRALALGMSDREVMRVVHKESPTALLTGLILALFAFLRVVLEYPDDKTEAAAIAITLGVSIILSIALGIMFSYGIGKMNRCDPADGAAPLLTTISDLIGIGLLCGIATSMVP